jgi:hypothetical protein
MNKIVSDILKKIAVMRDDGLPSSSGLFIGPRRAR